MQITLFTLQIFLNISVTEAMMPRFAESIPNVTVTIGRDALLACVVENLRGYKVGELLSINIRELKKNEICK